MHKSITALPPVSPPPTAPPATQEENTAARAGGLGTPAIRFAPRLRMTERITNLAGAGGRTRIRARLLPPLLSAARLLLSEPV